MNVVCTIFFFFVLELGTYVHPSEDDLVCKCTNEKIPYFNAPVYLENKEQIGKVDEIFGPIRDFFFSVKLKDDMKAGSFAKNTKVFPRSNHNSAFSFCYISIVNIY